MIDIIKIEELSLNAWPAVRVMHNNGCVLRFADGYTKRSNSVNALYHNGKLAEILSYAESAYSKSGLPTVFKILGYPKYAELDGLLEARGYGKIDPTTVKTISLSDREIPLHKEVRIEDSFSPVWIEGFIAANRLGPKRDTVKAVLNGIAVERIAASVVRNGEPVAFAFGALEEGWVGIFDVFVKQDFRGSGYGRRLMESLLNRAKEKGARNAYLQVMDANHPANRLYDGLGFEPAYAYWYRKTDLKEKVWA